MCCWGKSWPNTQFSDHPSIARTVRDRRITDFVKQCDSNDCFPNICLMWCCNPFHSLSVSLKKIETTS